MSDGDDDDTDYLDSYKMAEMDDSETKNIIKALVGGCNPRFRYFRTMYRDGRGNLINLGTHDKNPNYKVVDQNDLVEIEFTFWIYSLSKPDYGIRLDFASTISILKKGIPNIDKTIHTTSSIAYDVVLPM